MNDKALAPVTDAPIAPFGSINGFETAQRVAKALMSADIVPQQFRGSMGNTLIAMELAARTGSSILAVMQSLYVVHGNPGWSGSYCIAALNQSGRFAEPLHFEFQGAENSDAWGCRAVTTTKAGKRVEGPLVTIQTAKAEGWYGRSGSKWKTMPELMLRYRAATWFARTEAPELLMGMQTVEELADIGPQREQSTGVTLDSLKAETIKEVEERTYHEIAAEGRPVEEPEPMMDGWPKWDEERQNWYDSQGVYYDPEAHAAYDYHTAEHPAANNDGTFRARRGATHKARELAQAAKARRDNPSPPARDDAEGQPAPVGSAPAEADIGGTSPEVDNGRPAPSVTVDHGYPEDPPF